MPFTAGNGADTRVTGPDYPLHEFWNNGFCILRGFFSEHEVAEWRVFASTYADRDLFAHDALRKIVLDPRVLEIARDILSDQALVYFGDSNAMVGSTDAGFHKDNADKNCQDAPDWQGEYPIIRFGLYTDDHFRFSGGLDLRQGSHRTVSVNEGRHVAARTRPGDLVVWNLRTTHSGGAHLLRNGAALNPATLAAKIVRRLPKGWLTMPEHRQRIGIFWTFGLAGSHLDRYIAYLKTRRYSVDRWQAAMYPQEALADAAGKGVEVRQVRRELELDPPSRIHEEHVPLPFRREEGGARKNLHADPEFK